MPTPKKGPRLGSGPAHQKLMLGTMAAMRSAKTAAGPLGTVMIPIVNPIAATTVAAANHFSCTRSSPQATRRFA